MHLPTILTLFSAGIALSAPTSRDDSACTPVSYTLSDYSLTTSPSSGVVDFKLTSFFSVGNGPDPVQYGAHCHSSGANSNECDVAGRRLLFDLRGPLEQAYYQITHTWVCGGATWMSGTAVKVEPLNCRQEGDSKVCTGGPVTFAPQNVRNICETPTC